MVRIYQDGEQTVIDGEGLQTFIRPDQRVGEDDPCYSMTLFGEAIAIDDKVSNHTIMNFAYEQLTGNPFKDCYRLIRWYFK